MSLPSWYMVSSYGGTAVELCGAVVGILRWRQIAGGQRAITFWFAAAALGDIAVFVTANLIHNSQPAARVWFAFSVVFALWALALFQHSKRKSVMLCTVVGFYLVAWGILAAFVEPLTAISTYSGPLHALVILTAAVLTLFGRASFGRGDLFADPGFLIAAGLAGYAVSSVLETLVGQLWLHDAPQYVDVYYATSNIVTALAEVVMIKALFLPLSPSRRRSL